MPENALRDMDENELAALAAAGNDKAMAMLIATVMPIAKAKAAGFAQVRISDEDLVQEGMLGFLEAVKKFDPSKGVPFKAYASVCIKNRMINAFNRNNSAANSPLTGAVPIDDEQLTDHASNPENIIDEAAAPAKLWRIVDSALSVYERRVLDLMLEEKSYSQIAEILGTEDDRKIIRRALLVCHAEKPEKVLVALIILSLKCLCILLALGKLVAEIISLIFKQRKLLDIYIVHTVIQFLALKSVLF